LRKFFLSQASCARKIFITFSYDLRKFGDLRKNFLRSFENRAPDLATFDRIPFGHLGNRNLDFKKDSSKYKTFDSRAA